MNVNAIEEQEHGDTKHIALQTEIDAILVEAELAHFRTVPWQPASR